MTGSPDLGSQADSDPDPDPSRTSRLPTLDRVACLLFVSGLCSLVYQVVWLRSLRLVFGSSTPATSAVLALFMGGLGAGGAYFGRRSLRSRNPLALYSWLELGIAASAALSLALVWATRETYLAIGGSTVLGDAGATLVRLLLSALVLGAPTFLMGGTLPVMAQAIERRSDVGRRIVAWFYGVNTLGAVAGALITTFFALELVGVSRSLWLACLLNVLLALVARSWGRAAEGHVAFQTGPVQPKELSDTTSNSQPSSSQSPGPGLPLAALLSFAFVAGFLFFLMELVWYRMLTPLLGGSSYTFGLILALALLGIGGGGLLFALGSRDRRAAPALLALSAAFEAAALALPLALGDRLAYLAHVMRDLQGAGFAGAVAAWTLVASLVVLPASVVAGYQFPLLVSLIGRGREHVGSDVGRAYAWNTWGAVLGSLLGGLVLLPWLGAVWLWRVAVGVLAVVAVVLVLLERRHRERLHRPPTGTGRPLAWLTLATAAAALPLSWTEGPTAYWRHSSIATARAPAPADPNALRAERRKVAQAVVAESDGRESTVALLAWQELSLMVNGKSDGSYRGDAPTQVMGGLLGAALHPDPRVSLVIGLGTGMTAGWLAQVPSMERVDVVELEPAMVELSRYFDAANHNLLDLPNVDVRVGDGRELVRTTDAAYDIIFSEPSNPYRAGVADLFSEEFYTAVARRLAPDGVFLQWLQLYDVDAESVATVYGTLKAVFPHVETWQTLSVDLVLMASNEPVRHDFERVRRRMSQEPYRSALADVLRVAGAEGFYSGYVGGDGLADALSDAASARFAGVNTDDQPTLEFSFARSVGRAELVPAVELHRLAARRGAHRPVSIGPAPDWRQVDEMRRLRSVLRSLPPGLAPAPDADGLARDAARAAYAAGRVDEAWRQWRSQPEAPLTSYDLLLVADGMLHAGDLPAAVAADALAALAAERPGEAALLRALYSVSEQDAAAEAAEAGDAWRQALAEVRADPWVDSALLLRALEHVVSLRDPAVARTLFEALDGPLPGYLHEQSRVVLRLHLAAASAQFESLCRQALEDLEPHVLWVRPVLRLRLACLRASDDPRAAAARDDLARFDADDVLSLSDFVDVASP